MKNSKKRASVLECELAMELLKDVVIGSTDFYAKADSIVPEGNPLKPVFHQLYVAASDDRTNRNEQSFRDLRALVYVLCKHFSQASKGAHAGLDLYVKKNKESLETALQGINLNEDDLRQVTASLTNNSAA
jgi:hypothetical protein